VRSGRRTGRRTAAAARITACRRPPGGTATAAWSTSCAAGGATCSRPRRKRGAEADFAGSHAPAWEPRVFAPPGARGRRVTGSRPAGAGKTRVPTQERGNQRRANAEVCHASGGRGRGGGAAGAGRGAGRRAGAAVAVGPLQGRDRQHGAV